MPAVRREAYYTGVAVRVLIVDPQPFFCESLAQALGAHPRLGVVGWTTDELEAVRLARLLGPGVVLTEVALEAGSGLSLARRLREACRVVVLTRGHEGDVLLDAAGAGALGCLSHEVGLEELPALVERAAEGRFAVAEGRLHEALKRAGQRRGDPGERPASLAHLSPREREVLELLARGFDNEAIAGALYLSVHTVRTHVGNIMRKLGVHSRAGAARLALASGEGQARILRLRGPDLGEG